MPADGFLSLLETHEHLDELFSLHQQAVLTLRWKLATELLAAYRTLWSLHVDQEEQQLLPLFARAGSIERAPVVLFTGQHRKMLVQLDRLSSQIDTIQHDDDVRRKAIELLDLETGFKHLVEHHYGAETAYFYPALQRVASEQEAANVVVRCWNQWSLARTDLVALVSRAQLEVEAATPG